MIRILPARPEFSGEDCDEILRRIDTCLRAGRIAQGENVRELEEMFARYVGARHAIAVSSGGAAIEICMRLLNGTGQEVLVPSNTFAATAMAVLLAGGRVRFVDADPNTFGVSLAGLQAAATPVTVGVIVVHVGGIVTPEIEAIRDWCHQCGYWLFEDAAHAHGSDWNGRMAGRFGRAAAFSFFSTKVMTSGEGGMVVTDDEDLARGAQKLRDYGKTDPWVSSHDEIGSNWKMAEFCAAVGVVQLKRLDEFIARREELAGVYTATLAASPGITPVLPAGRSSWYKYIVLLDPEIDRERVRTAMKAQGISLSGGVYDTPLHLQPVFQGAYGRFPLAEDICSRHICLPLYPRMTQEDAYYVSQALKKVVSSSSLVSG